MALYTNATVAAARLGRYAGLAVPSTSGASPTPMDDAIAGASALIEEFIGYKWESDTYTETIPLGRDGQGKLTIPDVVHCPVSAVSSVAVPSNAQYYGPQINLDMLEWSSDGWITLAYPVVYSPQRWVNPIPLGRSAGYNAALKLYPDEITIGFTAGRTDPVPPAFQAVCIDLMAVQLMRQDDPESLMVTRLKLTPLWTDTQYRDDPFAEVLRRLSRWKR